ncbi:hypothetical protein PV08_09016 [Exophiala spinifera]|uniref:Zn(2)-C6 fungal-type domain-containing protein n=1 Tax=Exophiala spinifera TaxID=91928 RepID=A0A0D2BKD2_9EURO|nr:uncharacterized protein PV08_09016 [Exophiala spinifera]KIW11744.1 hypothetical protein PV08_09016 [Exophiala spinifera]
MSTTPPAKKACDACRRRKVKCSRDQPCTNCGQMNLQCTYLAVPQKKGPKGLRANVIPEIRATQQQASPSDTTVNHAEKSFKFKSNSLQSPSYPHNTALLSKRTIDTCIEFYFSNMPTTAWILNQRSLCEMISSRIGSDLEVYCLTASLCAFVMVQPGVSLVVGPGSHYEGEPPEHRHGYAKMILDEIARMRKNIDYIEAPTLNSIHISFFLFSCYFTLEKQNLCWFHLREAATLAQIMGMHHEASYTTGDDVENMYKRRMYWLLLVTERAYSLERHRPLTLQPSIELPAAQDIREVEIVNGFLYLISLFRCIDDEFMALWNNSKKRTSAVWLLELQQQLTDALPPELKTTEDQAAAVRITLHWLRIMVWQLSIASGALSSTSNNLSMTFKYPIDVASDLIHDIEILSTESMEVHGVGLIKKLFDVACTLTDVTSCIPLGPSADGSRPSTELLDRYLKLISQLRGGSSRYLPLLLAKVAETIPTITPPAEALRMSIIQGYAGAADNRSNTVQCTSSTAIDAGAASLLPQTRLMHSAYSPRTSGRDLTLRPQAVVTPPRYSGPAGLSAQTNPPPPQSLPSERILERQLGSWSERSGTGPWPSEKTHSRVYL